MDGEDGLGGGEGAAELAVEHHGDEGGLPVVALNKVGVELQEMEAGQHGLGEVGEALAVVQVAVDGVAVKILLVVHKVDLVLLGRIHEPEESHVALPPGQLDGEAGEEFAVPALVPLDLPVVGQEQADLIAVDLAERLGQRLHHVAQAAGFDEGSRLGGSHCDFHTVTPFLIISGCSGDPRRRVPERTVTFLSRMVY